ncbi:MULTISPECIES: nitrite reductase small subunit NirD [unclassified Nocardioides]|uniref:nitrite reductase small subunit NirD n=1 Tax=unclassified Nocardioides TaxID=2615069 RepID=UPI0006FB9E23|nr:MULTISPECIES: nitrite reductase small subunit NirD [unclassified Nocardioides]KRA29786.1 nitrite reductase small subunit [Nocardioides sp. Root614]KRA86710.1 nitrite reductase small subunit [Nocardioides sp. Root682]
MTSLERTSIETVVCRLDQIRKESGVTALVAGEAVAVFRTYDDQVYALSNFDPFGKASVLSRGIVGTKTVVVDGVDGRVEEQVPFVASPLLKQPFDLRTGICLDNAEVSVPTYDVRVIDGVVAVGAQRGTIAT